MDYVARGDGFNVFLTGTAMILSLRAPASANQEAEVQPGAIDSFRHDTVVRMRLIGASDHPLVTGVDQLPGTNNYFIGQAEALLVRGQRIVIDRMTLNGSGDALTTYSTIYMVDSKLVGHGDTILAYAALYCLRCEIHSIGPFTWTRTPQGSHGNVFVKSTFFGIDKPLPWTVAADGSGGQMSSKVLARLPRNGPGSSAPNFPYAEMVLIDSKVSGCTSASSWLNSLARGCPCRTACPSSARTSVSMKAARATSSARW